MFNHRPLHFFHQHRRYISFCFVYLLGLIAGALYVSRYPFSSLMRLMVYPQMSIVIGVIVSALPFIVFYILLRYATWHWTLAVAFLRAFTFMYCFAGVSLAYADAGWLVRCLILFSDCFLIPLFLGYAVKKLEQKSVGLDHSILFCLLFVLVVRCLDSYVVSPFTLELLLI